MIKVNSASVETDGSTAIVAAEFMSLVCNLTKSLGEKEVRDIFEYAINKDRRGNRA